MIIVGERINSSRVKIAEAIKQKDVEFIRKEAIMQVEAGARMVDVNVGTFVAEEPEYLKWIVQTIQEAIDAAQDGFTVFVLNGTYNGSIDLDKEISLIGTGYNSTVIIDCVNGVGINVTTNNSLINGFEIRNCDIGVVVGGEDNTIRNNSIHDNNWGILLNQASDNFVNYNRIYSNSDYGLNKEISHLYLVKNFKISL